MNLYEEHFVAFLDILGFKYIINTKEFEDVQRIFSSIIDSNASVKNLNKTGEIDVSVQNKKELENYNEALFNAKIYIMSDSIVIAVRCDCSGSLAAVINICNMIQQQLYKLETPVLLRGAIAKGSFYMGSLNDSCSKNTLVFGKGLVDAYLAQENYAVYPRVIVSQEVMTGYKTSITPNNMLPVDEDDGYHYLDTLSEYLIPADFDSGNDENRQGDLEYFNQKFVSSDSYKSINKLINDKLMCYNDVNLRKKYIWLAREIERIKENYLKKHGKILMTEVYASPS